MDGGCGRARAPVANRSDDRSNIIAKDFMVADDKSVGQVKGVVR